MISHKNCQTEMQEEERNRKWKRNKIRLGITDSSTVLLVAKGKDTDKQTSVKAQYSNLRRTGRVKDRKCFCT
jgi:hypothetical protein